VTDWLTPDDIDIPHLLTEHRAATDQLRRLRAENEALREAVRLTVVGTYRGDGTHSAPFAIEDKGYDNHAVTEAVFDAVRQVVPVAHLVTERNGPCHPDCDADEPHRPPEEPVEYSDKPPDRVVDLMAALEQSIAEAKAARLRAQGDG
jgi:hypothetical protein